MNKLLEFICRLEASKIHYRIEHNRDDSIIVLVAIPGERWEIEFFADEHLEIEVFKSNVPFLKEADLERLFKEHPECETEQRTIHPHRGDNP